MEGEKNIKGVVKDKEISCCDSTSSCCGFATAKNINMEDIKNVVRDNYARIAVKNVSCCDSRSSCCGSSAVKSISEKIGYTETEINAVPEGANLGLGCGNPTALASLKAGEVVLDLGSGAGFDCFLAADKVGEKGRVIGVDMTPEMLAKARENAKRGHYSNVEFRLGEIENLPVGNNSVDVVISNCVINLVPDKKQVFREIFRVLRPGGRVMISDIVLLKELPDAIMNSAAAYVGCVSGAIMRDEYIKLIELSGFHDVEVVEEKLFPIDCLTSDPTVNAIIDDSAISPELIKQSADSIVSINVRAVKERSH